MASASQNDGHRSGQGSTQENFAFADADEPVALPARWQRTVDERPARERTQSVRVGRKVFAFETSPYAQTPAEFRAVLTVLGRGFVAEQLAKRDEARIDGRTIEQLFQASPVSFFLSKDQSTLYGTTNPQQLDQPRTRFTKISARQALQAYGLRKLAEAVDRLYVKV